MKSIRDTSAMLLILLLTLLTTLATSLPHGPAHDNDNGNGHNGNNNHGNCSQAVNRTFTLTTVTSLVGKPSSLLYRPVLITPPSGVGSAIVYGSNQTTPYNTTDPLVVYIYNGDLYRKCDTSPTGGCLGFLTKAYGGALTGWYFQFSEDEEPRNYGPGSGPIRGGWKVEKDPEDETREILYNGSGSALWTLCGYGGNDGYSINSSPVPSFAVNGPYCREWGFKFKVRYTKGPKGPKCGKWQKPNGFVPI